MGRPLFPASVVLCILVIFACPASADDAGASDRILRETVTVGGMARTWLAYVPAGDLPRPALVVVLHGSLGSGQAIREQSAFRFERLADSRKCIIAYPDGYGKHWNDCRTAPKDSAHKENIGDVAFITAVIDVCREKWQVDPGRVYAAGFSNGGHMCFRLASEAPERFAGIAVIGACLPAPGWTRCPAPQPGIPVMIVNGSDDPINPFEGGTVRLFWFISKGEVVSSLESARVWLKPDDRGRQPVMTMHPEGSQPDNTRVECLSWPESRVRLYIVHGGGHTIPGGDQYLPEFLVGRTCRDMDIAEEAWEFLEGTPTRVE